MLRVPSSHPNYSPLCDPRLPQEALAFRMSNGLATAQSLNAINVTAWLYRDKHEGIQVNPNTTIAELREQFGPAETPDAEVGIHSEGRAAEYFRTHGELQVLQIFTERFPCRFTCAPLLRQYFPDVPWYYYFDRYSWVQGGRLLKTAGQVLKSAYAL